MTYLFADWVVDDAALQVMYLNADWVVVDAALQVTYLDADVVVDDEAFDHALLETLLHLAVVIEILLVHRRQTVVVNLQTKQQSIQFNPTESCAQSDAKILHNMLTGAEHVPPSGRRGLASGSACSPDSTPSPSC